MRGVKGRHSGRRLGDRASAFSPTGLGMLARPVTPRRATVIIGVPKEVKDNEYRVALTPEGARELTHSGHTVKVQKGAAEGYGQPEERYVRAGAEIVDAAEQAWDADMVLKVKEPIVSEFDLLRDGQILFAYLHLAASRELTEALL